MSKHITLVERETIICFNEGEKVAEIYTHNKRWQRQLENKLHVTPIRDNGWGGKTYEVDKSRIMLPKAKREISAEQKAKLATQLQKARRSLNEENNRYS